MVRGIRRVPRSSMVGGPLQCQRISRSGLRDAWWDWLHSMRCPARKFIPGAVRLLDPRFVRSFPYLGASCRMGHLQRPQSKDNRARRGPQQRRSRLGFRRGSVDLESKRGARWLPHRQQSLRSVQFWMRDPRTWPTIALWSTQ